jgi:predicted amidohydrolase YtcJ
MSRKTASRPSRRSAAPKRCATGDCAYVTFDEGKKGSLEPGKLADVAILSADPLSIDELGLRDITAAMTMVGGKAVHETPNWNG